MELSAHVKAPPDQPNREKEVFEAALDRSPGEERQGYLESECGDDKVLLERVQLLLRAHQTGEDFLPEEPRETIGIAMEKPGDRIGRYRLLQQIGEGGCGAVYMAEQQEPVRRKVALKVIKLGMDTRQVVARFGAERQALALMDHPNIAKVLDAGATDTGRPYFVMELVGGIKITDYCDQNNLSTRERLDLFIQVCRALQHAHQKGIIHRDIKPSNVLVTMQDGVPVPKVIDFGIAKATEGRLTDQTVFTAFEQFLGTPAYMSPEQAQLGGIDVDTRSDIYSLGVLLYELLTGKTPFDSKELLSGGLDAMRRAIQEKDPPTPSTRLKLDLAARSSGSDKSALRTPHSPLDRDLDWIVMKCLEKDRARRYETANGLATDIERHLKNEPVAARPPSRLYEFQKTFRRHKFGFAATATVIVALSGGIVATSLQAVRARRAEREKGTLLQEAKAARQDGTEKLWASYVAQSHALRVSGEAGRHFESLATLGKAAAIRPSLALSDEALLAPRNDAIASMILPDIRWLERKDFTKIGKRVCLDSNFERYAIADESGAVIVRRAEEDREEARLPGVGFPANNVGGFSPDGKLLVVTYEDGYWRVWDWSKPAIVLKVWARTGGFAPDSRTFAISDSTNIVVHDLVAGERIQSISLGGLGSSNSPGHILFDPSGQRLALFRTESENTVAILDVHTGRTLKTLQHPAFVWSVAWHPNGKYLATGSDENIRIWDSATGERLWMWRADAVSLVFNHRGDVLVSSGWGGYTRLWEFKSRRELIRIYKSGHVGFSPDDLRLTLDAWKGRLLEFFEVATGHGLRTVYEAAEASNKGLAPVVDWSGKLLAFRTQEGMGLLDFHTGRPISSARRAESSSLVGFDENGENVILTGREGLFRCPITKSAIPGIRDIGDPILVSAGAFVGWDGWISGNGKVCAITSGTRGQFFRADTFEKQAETGVQPGMRYCDLNFDGSLFASGAFQHPGVIVWNTQTGAPVKNLPTRTETPTAAFSPDGRCLVVGDNDEYCFWEVASWSVARRIAQEPGNDFAPMMAFSRDGRTFAGTHSRDKIRLYDAATGKVLADLANPNSRPITGLVFNHDGTLLAVAESGDALRLWDLRRIRRQLVQLGLDWDQPHYPEAEAEPAAPTEEFQPATVTRNRWDPAADFSATDNPNGPWSYGYSLTLGGRTMPYTERINMGGLDIWQHNIAWNCPKLYHNPTAGPIVMDSVLVQPGGFGMHPGPGGEYSVARFTVPITGLYHVTGSFFGDDNGGRRAAYTTTDVHILTNGVSLVDGEVIGYGAGSGPTFDFQVTLSSGDQLDFAVGFGSDKDYGFDSTGLSAQITAMIPPVIVRQPASQAVAAGGNVTLNVGAAGTPPLSYQWRLNSTNLPGATNSCLTLAKAALSQSGTYAVLVTSTFGQALSSNALLTVRPP